MSSGWPVTAHPITYQCPLVGRDNTRVKPLIGQWLTYLCSDWPEPTMIIYSFVSLVVQQIRGLVTNSALSIASCVWRAASSGERCVTSPDGDRSVSGEKTRGLGREGAIVTTHPPLRVTPCHGDPGEECGEAEIEHSQPQIIIYFSAGQKLHEMQNYLLSWSSTANR